MDFLLGGGVTKIFCKNLEGGGTKMFFFFKLRGSELFFQSLKEYEYQLFHFPVKLNKLFCMLCQNFTTELIFQEQILTFFVFRKRLFLFVTKTYIQLGIIIGQKTSNPSRIPPIMNFKPVNKTSTPPNKFQLVSCYKDQRSQRAIEGRKTFYDPSMVISKWFERALEEGNTHFGMEYDEQCYTSRNAEFTYNRHGRGTGCRYGRGGSLLVSVYQISTGNYISISFL